MNQQPINPQQTVIQSEAKPDRIQNIKTIYQASGWEIFWRNFLAGVSRAFGTIIIFMAFFLVAFIFFINFAYPHLEPLVSEYRTMMKSFNSLTGSGNPLGSPQQQPIIDPNQIEQIISNPEIQNLINQ